MKAFYFFRNITVAAVIAFGSINNASAFTIDESIFDPCKGLGLPKVHDCLPYFKSRSYCGCAQEDIFY